MYAKPVISRSCCRLCNHTSPQFPDLGLAAATRVGARAQGFCARHHVAISHRFSFFPPNSCSYNCVLLKVWTRGLFHQTRGYGGLWMLTGIVHIESFDSRHLQWIGLLRDRCKSCVQYPTSCLVRVSCVDSSLTGLYQHLLISPMMSLRDRPIQARSKISSRKERNGHCCDAVARQILFGTCP
jgi:hypothetical protein